MPVQSQSVIVGGGAELLAPVTVNTIPRIVNLGPPGALSDSIMRQWADGAVEVIAIGPTDVRGGVGATETFRLRQGMISEGGGVDSLVIGRAASATAQSGIALGTSSSATGANATVVGAGASANAASDTAVGSGASCGNVNGGVALGGNAVASGAGGASSVISIGRSAQAIAAGVNLHAIAIGNSSLSRRGSLVIGNSAQSSANSAVNADIIVGHQSTSTASNGNHIIIGHSSTSNVANGFNVIIGQQSSCTGAAAGCFIIGGGNSLTAERQIVIGNNLSSALANHGWFGTNSTDIHVFVIGAGDTKASPVARTVRFTNATGNNNAAGDVAVVAPRSTGNAASATFTIQVGAPQPSGSTLHSLLSALRLSHTAVAGETALEVYDVDSLALMRVLVGPAGSGPGGAGRALYLA